MSASVETPGLNQETAADFIRQASNLVPASPDAPSQHHHQFVGKMGLMGYVDVWHGPRREIRISATTKPNDTLNPSFTTLTVREATGEEPAEAVFTRRGFPNLPDIDHAVGPEAIELGRTLLDDLR